MKSLLKYMKDYKKESILAPLFKMLEASFELFVPLVMAAIIDTGIVNGDKQYIFKMGGLLVLLAFGIEFVIIYFFGKYKDDILEKFGKDV